MQSFPRASSSPWHRTDQNLALAHFHLEAHSVSSDTHDSTNTTTRNLVCSFNWSRKGRTEQQLHAGGRPSCTSPSTTNPSLFSSLPSCKSSQTGLCRVLRKHPLPFLSRASFPTARRMLAHQQHNAVKRQAVKRDRFHLPTCKSLTLWFL